MENKYKNAILHTKVFNSSPLYYEDSEYYKYINREGPLEFIKEDDGLFHSYFIKHLFFTFEELKHYLDIGFDSFFSYSTGPELCIVDNTKPIIFKIKNSINEK